MKREITTIPGEDHQIYPLIEQYFDQLQRKIDTKLDNLLTQQPNLLLHPHFERRMLRTGPAAEYEPLRQDDRIWQLLYKGKIIAVVTKQMDDSNNPQFSFFDNLEEILEEKNIQS